MTRNQNILTTLRSLDPADRDIDPQGARAQTDLARILATDPSGPPSLRAGGRSDRPSRNSRTAWKLVLAGGIVTAAAAVVAVLPSITGGDRAFATWTPSPEGMAPEARAKAGAKCRETLQEHGAGAGYANDLRSADAVIVERRGKWTTVVLATRNGFRAMCIAGNSTYKFEDGFGSIGTPVNYTAPGPRDLLTTDLGTGTIDDGQLSLAVGAAGSEVAKVTYRSQDHGEVAATVSKGRFALWLPGDELDDDAVRNGIQVKVTYSDGSTGTSRLHL
ncbi:hypothetical protein [Actinomadura sp. 6N118]|uniref:hypothetical protein n=1 Tax=Actinomadura sp. 6N118 TaxID=3375151 RepID=UPI0037BC1754